MMKYSALLLWILSWSTYLSAQELELKRSVIANGGSTVSTPELMISYTVGEPIIGAERNGTWSISQGFQQGLKEVITSLTPSLIEAQVSMYPNPAHKELYIDLISNVPTTLKVSLYDLQARMLIELTNPYSLQEHHMVLNLERLSNGVYQVLLSDHENNLIDHFQLQKIP